MPKNVRSIGFRLICIGCPVLLSAFPALAQLRLTELDAAESAPWEAGGHYDGWWIFFLAAICVFVLPFVISRAKLGKYGNDADYMISYFKWFFLLLGAFFLMVVASR